MLRSICKGRFVIKKIGILTRDCAGINAAIRSVVRTAYKHDIEVVGIMRGFDGLIDGDFRPLDRCSVSGIINQGGTILKTARAKRFFEEKYQDVAAEKIRENNIDGLIVIGGNGSLTGAHILASKYNITVVGIPATIDNDINGVEVSLGADTGVNVALDALDKIRDTVTSLERIFIVEVMGRKSGYIAMQLAIAGGCEEVLVPELDVDIDRMCREIQEGNSKGKVSWIVIVAEGKAKAQNIADVISSKTHLETRVAVLGHIQRGGRPTAFDRVLAARLGNYAVEVLKIGLSDKCVVLRDDCLDVIDLDVAIMPKKLDVEGCYKLIKVLT